jgi:hypothetical protein
LPGYVEVVGAEALRKIDIQAGPGTTGARYLFRGMEVSEFSLKVHLQDDQDFQDWELYKRTGAAGVALSNPSPKDSSGNGQVRLTLNPISISHPFLNDPTINIFYVVVKSVLVPERDGDTGGWVVEIKLIAYRPLKVAQGSYKDPKGPTPDPDEQALIGALGQQHQAASQLARVKGQPPPAPFQVK